MGDHVPGILIGAVAAILLTPFLVAIWQKLAPPRLGNASKIPGDVWKRNKAIETESLLVGFLSVILLGIHFGLGAPANWAVWGLIVGTLLAVPCAWAILRNLLARRPIHEFAMYLEAREGLSFRSWLWVAGTGAALMVLSLLILSSRQ